MVLEEKIRTDGRGLEEVRPIASRAERGSHQIASDDAELVLLLSPRIKCRAQSHYLLEVQSAGKCR
eukprot:scaffold540257_cov51-Prasinocladus_malaysianus.AAC.1